MLKFVYKIVLMCFCCLFMVSGAATAEITDEAQRLYKANHKNVFQVQVVDQKTGKKTSIGSGFQFTRQGHIATNYHVLSHALHAPERYRIEYIAHDGTTGEVKVLDIDVVHDLGIVQGKDLPKSHLKLGSSNIPKGARIFSLGNPLDLGMTIIEGTYNGLMEKSLYRKILFSGSLNPGMSGGPSLDHSGRVLGVNVSTAGNDVSFLVPVEYVKELFDHIVAKGAYAESKWDKHIEEQLSNNQKSIMEQLLNVKWDMLDIEDLLVPGEITPAFKCWGETHEVQHKLYNHSDVNCFTEDSIFVSENLITGKIKFFYRFLEDDGLGPMRFYNLYEQDFSFKDEFENAKKKDATNFKCNTDFVKINDRDWKIAVCARRYKHYSSLYDVFIALATLNKKDKGFLAELTALGISEGTALEFMQKFLEEIR